MIPHFLPLLPTVIKKNGEVKEYAEFFVMGQRLKLKTVKTSPDE
jgi:hypothetical protein